MKRFLFGMLNPSKAGWPEGDLTVTKVCGFAARFIHAPAAEVTDGGAVFSDCGRYRYRLWRLLSLRTGSKVEHLARVDVVNLGALISTNPDGLKVGVDPFGTSNMVHIDAALGDADVVIAAWGSLKGMPPWVRYQAETVTRALTRLHDVQCLGKTADGYPRHPSRLAYATPLELFRFRRAAA